VLLGPGDRHLLEDLFDHQFVGRRPYGVADEEDMAAQFVAT
jgi:hypothetical protein